VKRNSYKSSPTISRENQIREAIDLYVNFYNQRSLSSNWRLILSSLLPSFEKYLLQGTDSLKGKTFVMKSLLSSCFYTYEVSLDSGKDNTIYFWPFQFDHCDFMSPIIRQLIKKNQSVEVIVNRPNLVPYLNKLGIDNKLADYKLVKLGLSQVCYNLIEICQMGVMFFTSKKLRHFRKRFIRALAHVMLVKKISVATKRTCIKGFNQYHMVGYDMSILGRVIIQYTNELGIPNGRIQNGAPNYLTSGYSKVKEVFFWDDESIHAYVQQGYEGKIHITGNVKLYIKISAGISQDWVSWLKRNSDDKKQRIMVAFSGPGHNTSIDGHIETIEFLRKIIIATYETCDYFIKLHPKDSFKYYQRITKLDNVTLTDKLKLKQKPDALDLLISTTALISGASTVALDALQLKKQVICLDPLNELSHFSFLKHNNVLKVIIQFDIQNCIKILSTPRVNKSTFELLDENPIRKICNSVLSTITLQNAANYRN